jgi:hypothetical protein
MYDSDRGIEELLQRLADEKLAVEWLADQMRTFVDLYPEWEDAVGRLASFLARQSDD